MWVSRGIPVYVVLAVLLAGCASQSGTTSTFVPAATVDAGRGPGRISGTVLDIEQNPIETVTVRILSKSNPQMPVVTLTTNVSGGFDAQGLDEGPYTIYATKEGYKDLLPLAVGVSAGATSTVIITMQEARELKAYHTSFSRTASFPVYACIVAQGTPTCEYAYDPGNLTIIFPNQEEDTGPLEDLIVEASWAPTVGSCANGVQTHVFSPDQEGLDLTAVGSNGKHWSESNPYHWDNVPERTALNGGRGINLTGEWKIQTWPYSAVGALGTPVDVDCMAAQTITIWISAFFVAPAPPDWSAFDAG